ncbi:hypothetical protein GOBAR_DD04896 [Gossypium barbadense]|nr:hypothetical protein GOBAR_DD04896 [Gossypium barbadense]
MAMGNFWLVPDCSATVTEVFNKLEWLPRLLGGYYSDCLQRVIGQTVGSMVKLDVHMDCARRGRFVRLAAYVDLGKLLVSKVRINGCLQHVEYEALPNIYFQHGMYRHAVDVCPGIATTSLVEESGYVQLVMEKSGLEKKVEDEPYGVNEGEISAVLNGEINGCDEVVTKERSNSEGGMWLGFPEKDVIETKGKQAKLRAKGKKVVMGSGPKSTLKVLKPNNGSLAMEGFLCDLKRSLEKDVMVSDPQVVKKVMIVDDTDGVEVVHVKIRSMMSSNYFFCSIAYASPHAMKRKELWHFLSSLAVSVEGPWMLASDFNSIIDGECSVRNLYILKFDHRPTLISLKPSVSKGLRPSRCLASWMSYVDFGNIVNSSWNNELTVGDNLENFQESVKEWNKQVYGDIFVRKRKLISKLERVHKVFEVRSSQSFHRWEYEL